MKLHKIIWCDSEDSVKVPAVAVVNMIFRRDGKSNIFNENCFTFNKFGSDHLATKVSMNPPGDVKLGKFEHIKSYEIQPGWLSIIKT